MFLPLTRHEMNQLGWDYLDIILVTGDAYVDHPSFGIALIGRYLLKHGFKVGVIAQPNIHQDADFQELPRPRLFIGISSGNVDSVVNNYTANKKKRSEDLYSPGGISQNRPDRALIPYANKIRQHYPKIPIVLGGVEASLRRLPHFDYLSETVRNSILVDAKADLLVYGQGEKASLAIAQHLADGHPLAQLQTLKNTALLVKKGESLSSEYQWIHLPDNDRVKADKELFHRMHRLFYTNLNPYAECGFVQLIDTRKLVINPPQLPATETEMDSYYDLDFERKPHFSYREDIPAFDMIRNSITIHRGCFGGCSFCAIGAHQGKFIQSRSEQSILREVEHVDGKSLTDLGGPSANMYRMQGKNQALCRKCQRLSCLYPQICSNLNTDHSALLALYHAVEKRKRFYINSGVRHDLALQDRRYLKELCQKYTSGILKIAPEHTQNTVLQKMFKPSVQVYENFVRAFAQYAQPKRFIVPYLIASFPGCSVAEMKKMMQYLQKHHIRIRQVQDFVPTPMTIATVMYYTERDFESSHSLIVAKKLRVRKLHRAMMQYFKPENRRYIQQNWNTLKNQ